MLALAAMAALAALSCTMEPGLTLDDLDVAVDAKMNQYDIPALSLAIIKDEKLVYVQSYGFSDDDPVTAATNSDLYRIASISKPVTAIAILTLVRDGELTLDQTVFGSGGILGNDFGSPPADRTRTRSRCGIFSSTNPDGPIPRTIRCSTTSAGLKQR